MRPRRLGVVKLSFVSWVRSPPGPPLQTENIMRGYHTRLEVIEVCINLRKQGLSLGKISLETGLSKSTVSSYVKHVILTAGQLDRLKENTRLGTIQNNRLRKGISRPWNRLQLKPEMSRILIRCLAHFLFDGSVHHSTTCYYNRSLYLTMRQRADVKKLCSMEGKIYLQSNGVYRLIYHSVEFADFIAQNIQNLLIDIGSYPKKWQCEFLKAFFDDEGNIFISKSMRIRRVRGYQANEEILTLVQKLLLNLGIMSRRDKIGKCVVVSGYDNLVRFQREVNFSSGITLNPFRKNTLYGKPVEKRELLSIALDSYRNKINQRIHTS
jgi:hypothetical protein